MLILRNPLKTAIFRAPNSGGGVFTLPRILPESMVLLNTTETTPFKNPGPAPVGRAVRVVLREVDIEHEAPALVSQGGLVLWR